MATNCTMAAAIVTFAPPATAASAAPTASRSPASRAGGSTASSDRLTSRYSAVTSSTPPIIDRGTSRPGCRTSSPK